MSDASPLSIYPCRWEWCREIFDTADRLARHVLDDHVDKETPVKREEIRLELRAFDGTSIGDSTIHTSLLMNDGAYHEDEEKSNYNNHSMRYLSNHDADADGEEQESDEEQVEPELAQRPGSDSLRTGPNTSNGIPAAPEAFRTPSPSRSSSFQALADASTLSPDPASMVIAPSPSIAEILANTLNNVRRTNREDAAGPSTSELSGPQQVSRPPSSNGMGQAPRSSSLTGQRNPAERQLGEESQQLNGDALSSHSRPASRLRTRTSSNASTKQRPTSALEASALSPIAEAPHSSVPQNGLQSGSQTSTARPFRTGSLRLEPNFSSETPQNDQATHAMSVPDQSQMHHEAPSSSVEHYQASDNYMNEMDMLGSSLDPSIPAFTQAYDMQNQSQWPLATQAPYSFDSNLGFDSQ